MLDAAGRVVSFSVVDTGIGIAPHMQEIIFEAFQQGDGTTSRQFGGTGLGLSISAGLSRLLGGEIKVKSSPGKGSTFMLYLPLLEQPAGETMEAAGAVTDFPAAARTREQHARAAADAQPAFVQDAVQVESRTTAAAVPGLTGAKVLLVDDDIRNIFALTSVLEEQGMVVINAENGLDGIETLRSNPDLDIVLMDMMMPELDGYDTIRIMRRLESVGRIPIIGISARAMKGDREKCIEAGASDYISKPVEIEHLLAVMQAWLLSP
jgi:CheY-like chemotaxis protein